MNSLHEHGFQKFPDAGLLVSSRGRGWSGLAAELRAHPSGKIPDICSSKTEITFAVRGTRDGTVVRRGNGNLQVTPSRSGTIWLCPKGVEEDEISITEAIPEVLHVYISDEQIDTLSAMASRPVAFDASLYRAGLEDEFVRQICLRILAEIREETAGGETLMEHLASVLLTHICGRYTEHHAAASRIGGPVGALDQRRLKRVLEYIQDNLETDLTVAEIAAVACLSRHHFARAFKAATGQSPNGYIGVCRINRALSWLSTSDMPLAEIAFACRFSSQSAFARAFRRQLGRSPGEYRKESFFAPRAISAVR
ncbi:helix-turn-helix transcriptional regulator [Rhizobium glycinendophyticum]|uniref:Helix-turn-helix transcriptional regulator n=2 Tax=Rhizobium glycinendophyticum TaxID=2589807 RepID=A0A504U6M8_9HYPH|nr:helix-turn-helix transcriptional regulator [Rhizobium glycinendophyticum]